MIIILKYFIAFITIFCLSWIPLIGAYDYEASVCIALAGLIYLIFFSKYLLPDERKAEEEAAEGTIPPGMKRFEVLLGNRFPGLGKTLHDFDFYRHYGAHVRGISRGGSLLPGDYMHVPLTHEDTLVVDADYTLRLPRVHLTTNEPIAV